MLEQNATCVHARGTTSTQVELHVSFHVSFVMAEQQRADDEAEDALLYLPLTVRVVYEERVVQILGTAHSYNCTEFDWSMYGRLFTACFN